jgi:hypothetical protein
LSKPKVVDPGFIYRGKYAEICLSGKRIRLVPDETYIIPVLDDPTNISVILKKQGSELTLPVSAVDYYKFFSIGRMTFTDIDPYAR